MYIINYDKNDSKHVTVTEKNLFLSGSRNDKKNNFI